MTPNKKLHIAMICDPVGDYKTGVNVSMGRFGTLLAKRGHKIIYLGAKNKKEKMDGDFFGGKVY